MPRWSVTLTRVERFITLVEVEAASRREARRLAVQMIDPGPWDPERAWPERVRRVEPIDSGVDR